MSTARDILVVDDTPANLTLMSFLLKKQGYAVRTATNAGEALEAIAARVPVALVVDVQMPGIDGLALTQMLRREDRTKALTVIAITAYAMKGDEERALAAGCDGYIPKPIDTRTIVGQIGSIIAQRERA